MYFNEEIMDDNIKNECVRNTVVEIKKGEYVDEIQESLLSNSAIHNLYAIDESKIM